jgi:hypothetical protein
MHPQNGGRPPPRSAGDDLPIERLPDRLDDQSISPTLSAQRAVQAHGLPCERLSYLAKHGHALSDRPLYEILKVGERIERERLLNFAARSGGKP